MLRALFQQLSDPGRLQPLGLVEVLDWTAAALDRVDRDAFFAKFNEGEAVPGLSPRVRGNPYPHVLYSICDGSIPASAGEPGEPVGVVIPVGVYPRECGGTLCVLESL